MGAVEVVAIALTAALVGAFVAWRVTLERARRDRARLRIRVMTAAGMLRIGLQTFRTREAMRRALQQLEAAA